MSSPTPYADPAHAEIWNFGGVATGIETHTDFSEELLHPTLRSSEALLKLNDHTHPVRSFTISLSPKVKRVTGYKDFKFAGMGVTTRADTPEEERIIRHVHSTVAAEVQKAQVAMTMETEGSKLIDGYNDAYTTLRYKRKKGSRFTVAPAEAQLDMGRARTQLVDSLVQLLNQEVGKLETTLGDVLPASEGSVSDLAGTYRLCFAEEKTASHDEVGIREQVDSSDPSSPTQPVILV